MNRRDALKSLLATPCVASVNIAQVRTNDVIVIRCDTELTRESLDRLYGYARACFPETTVMVLAKGLALEIVRPE